METVNGYFEEFASVFAGEEADPDGEEIAHPERLAREALDFTLDSLKRVDDYLAHLYEHRPEHLGPPYVLTALWGGAYVGEVIRRSAPRRYHWIDYDVFVDRYPTSAELLGEPDLGVTAVLSPGGGGFTLPINKIIKFLRNGPEDSVWFYATAECQDR
ncbi:hypothetical protein ACFFX1_43110 [Dactylosporangium sucinum]|uniref:Uncharacterized protein n=1 Tax=Dactylosporangium sucinum TaxID=1424081 RepID=A0A917TYI3_9ACTN|nr:hypothetical protein [Dactylosporangium sucinum]GGM45153.1 hypothetical protein GCM10007977_053370 [Dactylosporangium sucinum]